MDTGFLRFPIFIFIFIFLFCFILFSDTSIAHKPSSTDIKPTTKLSFDDEEEESVFSDLGATTQRDANSGNIPTFNPIPTTPNGPQPPVIGQEPPYPTFGGGQQPPYPTFGGGQQPPSPTFGGNQQPPYPTFGGGQQPPGGDTTTNQPPIIPGGGGGGGGNMPTTTGGGTWCIANPTASETALQVALDYACGYGGADCSAIQPGGACHDPDTVKDHASYAFNDYYQKNPAPTSCAFGGTAQLSYTDPSSGNCHYASSSSRTATSPPATPTLPIMTPPSTSTPIIPYTPTGPTGYGTEPPDFGSGPTGSPNSADKSSSKLALSMVTISCMILCMANLRNIKI